MPRGLEGLNAYAGDLHADVSGVLRFALEEPTPLLNKVLRRHWRANAREQTRMAGLVRMATAGRRPAVPWERARLVVVRRSLGTPDQDGAIGGLKGLIDILLPPGEPYLVKRDNRFAWTCKYKWGLAIVRDDGPQYLSTELTCIRVGRAEQQGVEVSVFRV